jgi:hypothetical protein
MKLKFNYHFRRKLMIEGTSLMKGVQLRTMATFRIAYYISWANTKQAVRAVCFMTVSCLVYSSPLMMEARVPPKGYWISTAYTALYLTRQNSCENLKSYAQYFVLITQNCFIIHKLTNWASRDISSQLSRDFGRVRLMLLTVARGLKAWTVFATLSTEIVCSNPARGMDVCVRLFCV